MPGMPGSFGPVQRAVRHARRSGRAARRRGSSRRSSATASSSQRSAVTSVWNSAPSVEVEVLADRAAVGEDLRRPGVLLRRDVAELLEQRQVDVRLDVAQRARVAVPVPRAAEVAALLDDADVVDAGLAQAGAGEQAAEAAADDDDVDLVGAAARARSARRRGRRRSGRTRPATSTYCSLPSARRRLSRSARYFARSASGSKAGTVGASGVVVTVPFVVDRPAWSGRSVSERARTAGGERAPQEPRRELADQRRAARRCARVRRPWRRAGRRCRRTRASATPESVVTRTSGVEAGVVHAHRRLAAVEDQPDRRAAWRRGSRTG